MMIDFSGKSKKNKKVEKEREHVQLLIWGNVDDQIR